MCNFLKPSLNPMKSQKAGTLKMYLISLRATYGTIISIKLLKICFPTMITASWTKSSNKQPAGLHCQNNIKMNSEFSFTTALCLKDIFTYFYALFYFLFSDWNELILSKGGKKVKNKIQIVKATISKSANLALSNLTNITYTLTI